MQVTREEGRRRLLVLADYLTDHVAKLPATRFNMAHWAKNLKEKSAAPMIGECGTAACAFGWATMIPEFKAAGLSMQVIIERGERHGIVTLDGVAPHDTFDAAAHFFGITFDEAGELFYEHHDHRTALAVANNIRRFVETGALPGAA